MRFHSTHESIVPKHSSPAAARRRASGILREQPFELEGAEVTRERQAGGGAKPILAAFGCVVRDERLDANILPDDGVVERLAAPAIPEHGRFALVRDSHRKNVPRRELRARECSGDYVVHVARDLDRRMFDPTGLRIDLRVLLLRARDDRSRLIEHDEARARRALVNRADELSA